MIINVTIFQQSTRNNKMQLRSMETESSKLCEQEP